MTNSFRVPQLLLRLALGIGFLTTVSDRLGFLGPFGTRNVEWGNWHNFIDYTGTLMPFLDRPAVNIMGGIATSFGRYTAGGYVEPNINSFTCLCSRDQKILSTCGVKVICPVLKIASGKVS